MNGALLGCVLSAALGVIAGWLIRGRGVNQRRVDEMLRRETRFRHPTARGAIAAAVAGLPVGVSVADIDRLVAGAERSAEGMKPAVPTVESTTGASALRDLISTRPRHHSMPSVAAMWLGHMSMTEEARSNGKCGKPVTTNLGAVVCLRDQDHEPPCQ